MRSSSSRQRIVQVLWRLARGGAERMVLDLSRGLLERGFDVRIIAANGGGELQDEINRAGIPLDVGPVTGNRAATVHFLQRMAKRHRPQIWHTHLGADVWGGLVARAQRIHPWVVTIHSPEERQPWLRGRLRALLLPQADQVACVSDAVRQAMLQRYRLSSKRLVVIPLGINLNLFSPRPQRWSFHDVPRLITVGRLVTEKKTDLLLQALAEVRRPWRLDVLGAGPELAALKRQAERLGILPRVFFRGGVPAEILADNLRDSDVFCLPSPQEGQSLAVLEAAAVGVPVVLNDLPVFHEWFDEACATFVPQTSASAWARALDMVLRHPESVLIEAGEARRRVRQNAGLDQMVERYLELYQRL